MATESNEVRFQPFLLWFLLKNGLLLGVGGLFLIVGTETHNYWWWSGAVIATVAGVLLAASYSAQVIIVSDDDVLFQYGFLSVTSVNIPLWSIRFKTHQSLIGRLFDYGTVQLQLPDETIELKAISSIRTLRRVVSQRRRALLPFVTTHAAIDVTPSEPIHESYQYQPSGYLRRSRQEVR